MHVDESLKTHIHVEFNITFPALPCRAIRVDTGDISGKFETEGGMQHARDGEIHKWQLSSKGERMHQAEYTSSSVIDNPFIALLDRQDIEEILDAVARHEGCNIFGWLEVKVRLKEHIFVAASWQCISLCCGVGLRLQGRLRTNSRLLPKHQRDHMTFSVFLVGVCGFGGFFFLSFCRWGREREGTVLRETDPKIRLVRLCIRCEFVYFGFLFGFS